MIHLSPGARLLAHDGPFTGVEHDHSLIFKWFPIDECTLIELPLYPLPIANALLDLPGSPRHIVFHDPSLREPEE